MGSEMHNSIWEVTTYTEFISTGANLQVLQIKLPHNTKQGGPRHG